MCAHFQGTSADASRIRRLTKAREEASAAAERAAQQVERELQSSSIREFGGSNRAAATADEAFRRDTVGLVTREDFVRHKATLDERIASEAEAARLSEEQAALRKRKLKLRRMKKDAMSKLSFADEEEDEDEDEGIAEVGKKQRTAEDTETCERDIRGGVDPAGPSVAGNRPGDAGAPRRLGKNPLVDTSFLPDDERDKRERELREGLRKKWLAEQDRIKAEPVTITYSYWDGSGHRRTITVKKGDTVGQFLSAVRQQLQPEFREMRATSVENILYVKEDLILPHHFTFYDFILNKARGKSGPLFHFDVHEDVRMQADATVEKDESHAGKVVERHWYEKNKHMFPASRWEVYDPKKSYGSYTIGERKKGDEVA